MDLKKLMFGRYPTVEDAIEKTLQEGGFSVARPDGATPEPPKPTGPLADLCADIVAHPEDYEISSEGFEVTVHAKTEPALAITRVTSIGIARIGHYYVFQDQQFYEESEEFLIDTAILAVQKHCKATALDDLAAGLAKVKAARLDERDKVHDYKQTLNDLSLVRMIGGGGGGSCRALLRIAALGERMLPVLEGTHKIVPVDEFDDGPDLKPGAEDRKWIDAAGKSHPTRAARRAANKPLVAAKRKPKKAGAP